MRRVKPTSGADYVFFGALVLLVIFGFVMLASASSDLAKVRFGDGYYYITQQFIKGLLIGGAGFLLGYFMYYKRWEKWALPLLIGSVVLLVLVFTPLGLTTGGASRWVAIGPVSFQPAEILKLGFLVYMASWIGKNQNRGKRFFEGFVPFMVIAGVVAFLLFRQPATTTAVVLFAASLVMYFMAGARLRFLVLFGFFGALAVGLLIYLTPYRLERVMTYLRPETADVLGEGYHRDQALIAIGSGGLTGVGYGKSTTKLRYLPEPIGDSIFAVVAEELGFVGSSSLIFLFFVLVWRGFMIARRAPDSFSRLLVIGFSSLIGFQAFVNIGAVSGLLPLTGVPLPYISFGGTSLAVFLTMGGIILNVSKYRR